MIEWREKPFYIEKSLVQRKYLIPAQYEKIEEDLNNYYEKKLTAKELSEELGYRVLGFTGDHPSAQIYAFDCFFKALTETDNKRNFEEISEEIIFDIAAEEDPRKQEYLLGILAFYANKDKAGELGKKLVENPNDAWIQDQLKILKDFRSAIEILKMKGLAPEMLEIIDLVINNFPEDTKKGKSARIFADLYAKTPLATSHPKGLSIDEIISETNWIGEASKATGYPERVYAVAPWQHTSAKKIEEAEIFGMPLYIEVAKIFEKEAKAGKKKYKMAVLVDTSPEETFDYIRAVRRAKDNKNWTELNEIRKRFKDIFWEKLDPGAKEKFGSKEEIIIIPQTIRDYSQKELDKLQEIRESIKK